MKRWFQLHLVKVAKKMGTSLTMALMATFVMCAAAFAETGTSMMPAGVTTIITDFGNDLVPTILALVTIIVPIGLSVWALGFGINKGIQYLQKRMNHSV